MPKIPNVGKIVKRYAENMTGSKVKSVSGKLDRARDRYQATMSRRKDIIDGSMGKDMGTFRENMAWAERLKGQAHTAAHRAVNLDKELKIATKARDSARKGTAIVGGTAAVAGTAGAAVAHEKKASGNKYLEKVAQYLEEVK